MNRRRFVQTLLPLALTPVVARTVEAVPQAGRVDPFPDLLAVPPTSDAPSAVDLPRLLHCIGEVESGNKDEAVGFRNNKPYARERYQISEAVWFTYTNRPWVKAHVYSWSLEIGRRHIQKLATQTNHDILWTAAAWLYGVIGSANIGLSFFKTDLKSYPVRVLNLYNDPTFNASRT